MAKRATKNVLQEIRLRISSKRPGAIEILKDVLSGCGISRQELVELAQGNHQYILFYPKSSARARRIRRSLKKLDCPGVILGTRTLSKKDWRDRWKKDLKPFALGKTFWVVPSGWGKKYGTSGRIPIIVDSAMAFGSGLHETTCFMARLIESCRGRFISFLDIGTGTGILSVAAIKCAATKVDGIDFNPDCIKVARANLKRNGCRPATLAVADIHDYPSRRRYDFVAANLATHDLVKAGRRLVSLVRPGKYLAISGVSLENVPVLKKAFRKYLLRPLKIIKGREWAALLYKKREGRQLCWKREKKMS